MWVPGGWRLWPVGPWMWPVGQCCALSEVMMPHSQNQSRHLIPVADLTLEPVWDGKVGLSSSGVQWDHIGPSPGLFSLPAGTQVSTWASGSCGSELCIQAEPCLRMDCKGWQGRPRTLSASSSCVCGSPGMPATKQQPWDSLVNLSEQAVLFIGRKQVGCVLSLWWHFMPTRRLLCHLSSWVRKARLVCLPCRTLAASLF